MNRIRWYGPSILLLVTLVTVMLAGPNLMRQLAWARDDTRITLIRDSLPQMPALVELSNAFKMVAESVEPSVVHIMAEQPMRSRNMRITPRAMPTGSGWVYDEHGHIITNNHVVEGADKITVKFSDGSERRAELVGGDPKTDVAVIKVRSGSLHPALIAEEDVQKGDIVFAFGSPLRFDFSISQGIVSATGRYLGLTESSRESRFTQPGYEDFIQTDAAINPGNSGGPLTNIYGQVIGMNTAIASEGFGRGPNGGLTPSGFMGLGFAIPAHIIVPVADQIIATNGHIVRGYMGVTIDDLSHEMARTFDYDGEGVLVLEPAKGLPGDKAGMQQGDIIISINDRPVTSSDELRFLVGSYPPGSDLKIVIFRGGETQTLTVTLATHPDSRAAAITSRPGVDDPEESSELADAVAQPHESAMPALERFGITAVEEFVAEAAAQLRTDHTPGVVVLGIAPGSRAEEAGLRVPTIITHVMNQAVKTPEEFEAVLEALPHDEPVRLRLAIWEPRERRFIARFIVLEPPTY